MDIKNWKESPGILKIRERLEDQKIKSSMKWIFEILVTLVFAAVVALMMFQTVTMQESSMEPTISVGDRFFINKAVYKFSSPKRGDLIVFRSNASDDAALHIRRVIGLPGETVQITNGRILIDGETYKEGKDFPKISNAGLASKAISLGTGEYFVLGDNRNNSEDSRHLDVGLIKEENIIGKLWIRFSPMDRFGLVE